MLRTTIVGSLPKPGWLAERGALRAAWRLQGDELREAHDDAVQIALDQQRAAGIDIVSDGEMRRRHYIWGFLEGLTGTDTVNLGMKRARGGRYAASTPVARIIADLRREAPVLLDALRFARSRIELPLKVTLPGPMTIVDSVLDEHYGEDERSLALRFAD